MALKSQRFRLCFYTIKSVSMKAAQTTEVYESWDQINYTTDLYGS
jgi:hypothetical protein